MTATAAGIIPALPPSIARGRRLVLSGLAGSRESVRAGPCGLEPLTIGALFLSIPPPFRCGDRADRVQGLFRRSNRRDRPGYSGGRLRQLFRRDSCRMSSLAKWRTRARHSCTNICAECKKQYPLAPSLLASGRSRYCSWACYRSKSAEERFWQRWIRTAR